MQYEGKLTVFHEKASGDEVGGADCVQEKITVGR